MNYNQHRFLNPASAPQGIGFPVFDQLLFNPSTGDIQCGDIVRSCKITSPDGTQGFFSQGNYPWMTFTFSAFATLTHNIYTNDMADIGIWQVDYAFQWYTYR